MAEMIDIDELNLSIEQAEDDIVELKKAITLAQDMTDEINSERFQRLFRDGFIKSYRDTAVVNIGLVRGDAQDGIKTALIGRAQFESYCNDMADALEPLKMQLEQTEIELAKDKKALAEYNSEESEAEDE